VTTRSNEWSGRGWKITVTEAAADITEASRTITLSSVQAAHLELRRRWFRWHLYNDGQPLVRLRGITAVEAQTLGNALRRLTLSPEISNAVAWHAAVTRIVSGALAEQRWIPTEIVDRLIVGRPRPGLVERVRAAGCGDLLTPAQLCAATALDADLPSTVSATNNQIMAVELATRRQFFDTIEKSPLTDEQARAVVCFDNRVQVLAAAGSGKTSVMVARAAYAVSRGFVQPDRILLLAFNKAAATELQDRVATRFAAAGIDSSGVRAATFHSFGLEVIGRATGEKPRLAPWLDRGDDIRMILRIVDELRDTSEIFRYRWDLYRTLFANAPTNLTEHVPDGYDKKSRETGYRTFAGEVVKSHSERLVANFLYLNGVRYEYERPYNVNVATATYAQYCPDFYYPDIDVWHEHWAIDRTGKPPAEFHAYADGMAWKMAVHAKHGSTLVESAWADVVFGDGLSNLRDNLSRLGLTFDWNPDRPVNDTWATPMKHEDLARLIRTFMTHVKSNSMTAQDLEARLGADQAQLNGYRTQLFLDVYWQIHAEWERRLAVDHSVDFEDMLVLAAGHLEAGNTNTPFDLIMVDEFQDASRARARLVRGLVNTPGRYLLAVGNDWQSINRFAGADLSVMTEFASWFGTGPQLALTTTFRCPETICDVASGFVSKNPHQFTKPMRSAHRALGPPVAVIRTSDVTAAVASYLQDLSVGISNGTIPGGYSGGRVTVDILGRYGFERNVLPSRPPSNLDVTFRTIHGSKGLEADYIVVPGMNTGTYGFPSTVADDPVLALAMPSPENYEHAEERRLLYVALTRARRQVTLLASSDQPSPFVAELLRYPHVVVMGTGDTQVQPCPKCGKGTMVDRRGKYGPFLGCSAFPSCRNTSELPRRTTDKPSQRRSMR
jgi:DNA helicase-4